MYRGGNTVNLDAKGRLALPTRFRGQLEESCGGHLVLTVHDDGCLLLYPAPEWEDIERALVRLPNQNQQTRRLQRMLLGHATEAEIDSHGRILVPPRLRDFAKLDKRVVLAGVGKKFEIWNEEVWEQSRTDWVNTDKDEGAMPESLENLTL
ncbi:MAG TPA: division/cell wall cluster transcriptional repressor MraZ [Gammaproteobacteria bacterium]|nr:division/cell wall cluster transcriptional repressor MraZ [Gammaproteobacteria bacterium]